MVHQYEKNSESNTPQKYIENRVDDIMEKKDIINFLFKVM